MHYQVDEYVLQIVECHYGIATEEGWCDNIGETVLLVSKIKAALELSPMSQQSASMHDSSGVES